MFRKISLGLALLLFTSIHVLRPDSVHATAMANSEIFFSNFQIVPAAGFFVFLGPSIVEAFAEAQNSLGQRDQEFNPSAGSVAEANAAVTFAENAHSRASALNLTAEAKSHAEIPGTITAQARSAGIGDLFNFFVIVGGIGAVNVTFSANLTGSLDVLTDAFGIKAETETIFALEVDGTPVLSFFKLLSIGPMDKDHFSISDSVRLEPATLTLLFGAPYFLFVGVDSESATALWSGKGVSHRKGGQDS